MAQLEHKTIVVTGALGQAGESAIRMFLERGAAVLATDRWAAEDYPIIAELQSRYGQDKLMYVQADIFEESEVQRVVAEAERHFGKLWGVYHTVYGSVEKPAHELSLEEWEFTLKGTLTSTFLVNKHCVPVMIRSGGGSIVNVSSVLAFRPQPGSLAYGAAKAGIVQLTRILATTYAGQNIRANVIVPGYFTKPETAALYSDALKQEIVENTLIGRTGTADEVNEMAAFLLSDASSYITGTTLSVDGGYKI